MSYKLHRSQMSNYFARHSNPVEGRGAMRYTNDSFILRHKMGFCLNVESCFFAHYSCQ